MECKTCFAKMMFLQSKPYTPFGDLFHPKPVQLLPGKRKKV
jgi:hypothetical protein